MDPSDNQMIAARIKMIRAGFDLTQPEMARIAGATKSLVAHWESGRNRPTVIQAGKLATHTGVTLDWLYLGREGTLQVDVARRLGLTS